MYSDFALQMAGPLCGSEEPTNEVLLPWGKILPKFWPLNNNTFSVLSNKKHTQTTINSKILKTWLPMKCFRLETVQYT